LNTGKILEIILSLSDDKVQTIIKSYKFLDLLGDMGGFMEIIFIVFSFFGSLNSKIRFK
jgi:hypothetical protein